MDGNHKSSIEKAILILSALGEPPYEYKVQELAGKLGFNRTTCYRTLKTLEQYSMVILDEATDRYKIGPEAYHIGSAYLYNSNYHSKLQDILVKISEAAKESVGMAVKDGDKIVSIHEIEIHQPMKLNDTPGKYFQANKGNYGKCIMAFQRPDCIEEYLNAHTFEKTCINTLTSKEELLEEYAKIRRQGYSTSVDELGIDIIGVGVPLFDKRGEIKACAAIAFYRVDGWQEKLIQFRDLLLQHQKELEKYLP